MSPISSSKKTIKTAELGVFYKQTGPGVWKIKQPLAGSPISDDTTLRAAQKKFVGFYNSKGVSFARQFKTFAREMAADDKLFQAIAASPVMDSFNMCIRGTVQNCGTELVLQKLAGLVNISESGRIQFSHCPDPKNNRMELSFSGWNFGSILLFSGLIAPLPGEGSSVSSKFFMVDIGENFAPYNQMVFPGSVGELPLGETINEVVIDEFYPRKCREEMVDDKLERKMIKLCGGKQNFNQSQALFLRAQKFMCRL